MKKNTGKKAKLDSKQTLLTFLETNKSIIFPVIIVFCLPVLLYLQTIHFGFIGFDETEIITNNIGFLSDFSNAPQAFLKDAYVTNANYIYRPMQTFSYMTDILLSGGNNLWMYHLTHVLLSGLISCVLFLLLRKFLIPQKLAVISTLIFCVHPLFVSLTAWVPARGDVLLLLFSLLSFLFFIEHIQKRKAVYLFLNWLTFTLALFCKETAVVLPILFILYCFAFSTEKCFKKEYLPNLVLYAVSGIFWFWLRSLATTNFFNKSDVGLMSIITNLRTIPESLANFFLFFDIKLIPNFSFFKTITGLVIIILIVLLFFFNKERTKKEKLFCLAWFLLLLLPTMVYKNEFIDYLNHRLFLPLVGILLFVLFCVPQKWLLEKDLKRKILVNGSYLCIVALLSVFTFINSCSYSDPIAFFNASTSQNPHNAFMYNNRGNEKINRGDFKGAMEDLTKALELKPDYVDAYNNRGIVFYKNGEPDKAISDYDKAIELDKNYADAYYNRGTVYDKNGELDKAIGDYDKAIELNANYTDAYYNRGTFYYKNGELDKASKDFDKAIELNPHLALPYYNRGTVYNRKGELDKAIDDYSKAIELDPKYAPVYYNRGNAFSTKGELDKAIKDYDKAIELDPNYAYAYNNRGNAFGSKGELDKAIKDYDKAIELNPDIAAAYFNRGNIFAVIGDFDKAIKDCDRALELNPKNADAYNIRGTVYKAKGMLKLAEQDFKMYEQLSKLR